MGAYHVANRVAAQLPAWLVTPPGAPPPPLLGGAAARRGEGWGAIASWCSSRRRAWLGGSGTSSKALAAATALALVVVLVVLGLGAIWASGPTSREIDARLGEVVEEAAILEALVEAQQEVEASGEGDDEADSPETDGPDEDLSPGPAPRNASFTILATQARARDDAVGGHPLMLADDGLASAPLERGLDDGSDADDPMARGVHLITTYFRGEYSKARTDEIATALRVNLENPLISFVHVLWQDQSPLELAQLAPLRSKLVLVRVAAQPTYQVFFEYASTALKRGALAVLANADIYFDDTLKCVKPVARDSRFFNWRPGMKRRPLLALTRRHAPECGAKPDYRHLFDLCDSYIGSHDVFIFAPPVPANITRMLNHTQNAGLGAENVVIWEFNHSKQWRAFNPCVGCRCWWWGAATDAAAAATWSSASTRIAAASASTPTSTRSTTSCSCR